jgi:5-methyltetrahydrofolate--homocysteine methyltransferase
MPAIAPAVPSLDITAVPRPARSEALLAALKSRVVIADGAMGTMLQDVNPTLDDFQQHEGCNEILNVTRPDIVETIHATYLETGIDAIETNTFGANWSNLSDYGIESRIEELARAGAEIARVAGVYGGEEMEAAERGDDR